MITDHLPDDVDVISGVIYESDITQFLETHKTSRCSFNIIQVESGFELIVKVQNFSDARFQVIHSRTKHVKVYKSIDRIFSSFSHLGWCFLVFPK